VQVIKTGYLYFRQPHRSDFDQRAWTIDINQAARFDDATAAEIVRHWSEGPLDKNKQGELVPKYPKWSIALQGVSTSVSNPVVFELIDVTDGRVYTLLERML
jgi:hypothetical protein